MYLIQKKKTGYTLKVCCKYHIKQHIYQRTSNIFIQVFNYVLFWKIILLTEHWITEIQHFPLIVNLQVYLGFCLLLSSVLLFLCQCIFRWKIKTSQQFCQ